MSKYSAKYPFELEVVSIRLVKDTPLIGGKPIHSKEDAIALIGEYLCDMDREMMCVLNLKEDNTPINFHVASVGAINQSIACPREIFKTSILCNAAKIILIHNHPSGKILPSVDDTRVTDKMIQLGNMMNIPMIDHIIVGGDNKQYFSFYEAGLLPMTEMCLQTDYHQLSFANQKVAEHAAGGWNV